MENGILLVFALLYLHSGLVNAKGTNPYKYRATRFGTYYSSRYYSYTGGKGWARYSRVYSNVKNHYTYYYNYMFEWMKTDAFTVYKNSPSDYISVCRNYEANENGTYLGVFTCPLPFVPESHSYCCGVTNAQYCCTFWDVPLNVGAAVVAMVMGTGILISAVYITVKLVKAKSRARYIKRRRKLKQRAGRTWREESTKRFHYPNQGYTADDREHSESDRCSLSEGLTAKAIFNSPGTPHRCPSPKIGTPPRYPSPNTNNGRMNGRRFSHGIWT